MDDKEYYSMMNRSSSYALQQELKKKQLLKKNGKRDIRESDLKDWTVRQGRADAEMLMEKHSEDWLENDWFIEINHLFVYTEKSNNLDDWSI